MDGRCRNAISRGALAIDVHAQIRRTVVKIRAERSESFEFPQLGHRFIGRRVNILRNNSTDGVGVLALGLVGRTDVDLQNRARRNDSGQPWNCADRFLQAQQALLNWITLVARLENGKDDCLRRRTSLRRASNREKLRHARFGYDFLVHQLLKGTHLRR